MEATESRGGERSTRLARRSGEAAGMESFCIREGQWYGGPVELGWVDWCMWEAPMSF